MLGTPHPKSGKKLSREEEEETKENCQEESKSKGQEASLTLRRSRGRVSCKLTFAMRKLLLFDQY